MGSVVIVLHFRTQQTAYSGLLDIFSAFSLDKNFLSFFALVFGLEFFSKVFCSKKPGIAYCFLFCRLGKMTKAHKPNNALDYGTFRFFGPDFSASFVLEKKLKLKKNMPRPGIEPGTFRSSV